MAARPVAALAVVAAALSLQEPGAAADFPLTFSKADVQGHPLEAEIRAYTAYTESQQEELPQFYRGDVEGYPISAAAYASRFDNPEYGFNKLPESGVRKYAGGLEFKTDVRSADFQLRSAGAPCTGGGLKVVPGQCDSYLQCHNGKYLKLKCGSPLVFNEKIQQCDWKANVECDTGVSIGSENVDTFTPEAVASSTSQPQTAASSSAAPAQSTTVWSWTSEKPTTTLATQPPTTKSFGPYKSVCYFTNWAMYRRGYGKYLPSHIDTSLCTHIVYGFAVLDSSTLLMKPHDPWADIDQWNKKTGYDKVVEMGKVANDGTKNLIAIGGWNDSDGKKFNGKYARLVLSAANRRKFIEHIIPYLDKYEFDGLDLDWEYPVCWQVDCAQGDPKEKEGFAAFVRELRAAFDAHHRPLLLSAAVSPSSKVIDAGYDVPSLSRDLDWIAVMTYDYHGQWDKKTGHVAPLYLHPDDDQTNFHMDYTMKHWLKRGATKDKLVVGMPLYGKSFTMVNPQNGTGLNVPTTGKGGNEGAYTKQKGFLSYYEICDNILNKGWTVVHDHREQMGPYAYKDKQWVSFDDVDTIRRKTQYIVDNGYAGGMVWALDLDDFNGETCGQGKYPLMNAIKSVLSGAARESPNVRQNAPYTTPYAPPSTTAAPYTPPSTAAPYTPPSTAAPYTPPTTASGFVNPWTVANAAPRPSSLRGAPCAMGQFQRHETRCDRFYQCDHGSFIERDCLVGQHWSGTRCDWPEKANCQVEAAALPLPPGVAPLAQHGNAL